MSTRPLIDKLGVLPGARVAVMGVDDPDVMAMLRDRTPDVTVGQPLRDTDVVLLAADSVAALTVLARLRERIVPAGAIWVVSRKGRTATLRDVEVIAAARAHDLVDNTVVAFSATHTALRLVIPRALRPESMPRGQAGPPRGVVMAPREGGRSMGECAIRLGVIVLAAGAGRRFGGAELLALLDDRPLLQHAVDAAADWGPDAQIAVLGHDAEIAERIVDWGETHRVRNPDPDRGLSSSLQLGIAAAEAWEPPLDGVFVALGDQPRVRPATFRALARAADADAGAHAIVVPRYTGEAAGVANPALLLRAAWPLVRTLNGDRGMGPVIAAHPELVLAVPIEGANPDVDTPEDLRRL